MRDVGFHRDTRLQLVASHERKLVLSKVWYEHLRHHPLAYLVPRVADIAELEDIVSLVHAPLDVSITQEIFEGCVARMGSSVSKWREDKIRGLSASASGCLQTVPSDHDYHSRLELAVCIFKCVSSVSTSFSGNCRPGGGLMWHPDFYDHCCNHRNPCISRPRVVDGSSGIGDYCTDDWSVIRCKYKDTWGMTYLVFHSIASLAVQRILDVCGINHRTASVRDVDALDPRVICLTCSTRACSNSVIVFPWRRAVSHLSRYYHVYLLNGSL